MDKKDVLGLRRDEFEFHILEEMFTQLINTPEDDREEAVCEMVGVSADVGTVMQLILHCIEEGKKINLENLKYFLTWDDEEITEDILDEVFGGFDFTDLNERIEIDETIKAMTAGIKLIHEFSKDQIDIRFEAFRSSVSNSLDLSCFILDDLNNHSCRHFYKYGLHVDAYISGIRKEKDEMVSKREIGLDDEIKKLEKRLASLRGQNE